MRGMATNVEKIDREAAELTRQERLTRFEEVYDYTVSLF